MEELILKSLETVPAGTYVTAEVARALNPDTLLIAMEAVQAAAADAQVAIDPAVLGALLTSVETESELHSELRKLTTTIKMQKSRKKFAAQRAAVPLEWRGSIEHVNDDDTPMLRSFQKYDTPHFGLNENSKTRNINRPLRPRRAAFEQGLLQPPAIGPTATMRALQSNRGLDALGL